MRQFKCSCPICEYQERMKKSRALEKVIQEINEKLHGDFRVVGITKNRWTSAGPGFQNIPKNEPSYSIAQFLEDQFKEKDAKAQESVDYSHIEKHVQDEIDDTWIVYKKAYNVKINQLREELKERTEKLKARTEKQTEKPPQELNFCRVFELPDSYPEGFCFGGGRPVLMLMVDWFNPWPDNPELETWEDVVKLLRPFLQKKTYVKPGKRYILITDFGASLVFAKED